MSDLTKPLVLDLDSFRSEMNRHKAEYENRKDMIRRMLDSSYVSTHLPQNIMASCFELMASAVKYEQTQVDSGNCHLG